MSSKKEEIKQPFPEEVDKLVVMDKPLTKIVHEKSFDEKTKKEETKTESKTVSKSESKSESKTESKTVVVKSDSKAKA